MIKYIIIGMIVLLVIYIFAVYNGLVKLNNLVKEAFATMDVYMKKRWDLIPNLVETVKGYAGHEEKTLAEVVRLRNSAYEGISDEQKLATNAKLTKEIAGIMMLAESYPDLKANQNFLDLSRQLEKTEEDIANARKYYNGTVREFNNKVQMFPSNVVAAVFGFKTKQMYETAETERERVEVKF